MSRRLLPRALGLVAALAALLAVPAAARARERPRLITGFKLGAGVTWSPGSATGHAVPEVEVGAAWPGGLLVVASAGYGAPAGEGTLEADPHLPGDGVTHYRGTWHRLALGVSAGWRLEPAWGLRPYLAAGPRVLLVRREVVAEAGGVPFGPTAETSVGGALQLLGGVERPLGPGMATGELQAGWGPVGGGVLAEGARTFLGAFLGYRLGF